MEPLALLPAEAVKFPTVNNPAVEKLLDNLRVRAQGSASKAIDRAANLICHGDRLNLALMLTGIAMLAWLLTYNSPRQQLLHMFRILRRSIHVE